MGGGDAAMRERGQGGRRTETALAVRWVLYIWVYVLWYSLPPLAPSATACIPRGHCGSLSAY
jgi:hypothetical protein